MNPTIIAAIIAFIATIVTASSTIIAALFRNGCEINLTLIFEILVITIALIIISIIIWRKIKNKPQPQSNIEQFFVLSKPNSLDPFREYLPEAREVRLCGRSLIKIIDENKSELSTFVNTRSGILKILLLDSTSRTVSELDSVLSNSNAIDRKNRNFPPVISANITEKDLERNIDILKDNNLLKDSAGVSQTLHLCKTLLPFSMIMVEKLDGTGWASILYYPLHPDILIAQRYTFTLSDTTSPLWQNLKQQFDLAWEDPSLSKPYS